MGKRGVAALSLLLVLLGFTTPLSSAPTRSFESWLDGRVPGLLSQYKVPGAAVSLVQDGRVVWTKGYGFADISERKPVTTGTVFQVASISKSVTAWGVMKLVEEGRIDLDAPVDRYLKRWHLPPSKYDSEVTVRRVLSHTAGLSLHGFPGNDPGEKLPTLVQSLDGRGSAGIAVRVIERPGRHWRYSGGGYSVLQLLVEDVTGRPFDEYMKNSVLHPLGMEHSSYAWEQELRPATARAYTKTPDPLPNYLYPEQAAAGLYTTAPDLARWVAAVVSPNAGGVLDATSLRSILTPAPATSGAPDGGFGLGVGIGRLRNGRRFLEHTGGNRGWAAVWVALPAERTGLVVLTNSTTGALLYADASCELSRSVAGATSELCADIAGTRSFVVRVSLGASVVLLSYLASVGVSVPKRRRVLRRPRGLRWTRVLIFPLLALTWFALWHTTFVLGKAVGLLEPLMIAMPPIFSSLSFILMVGLALVAMTAFSPRIEPRPPVSWRQRAALVAAITAFWLVVLYTSLVSSVTPATLLSAPGEAVTTAAVLAVAILASFFVWRRKGAGRSVQSESTR